MVETKGYSIWIMPPEQVYNELSGLILKLSGQYFSPKFEPHVTLIGELEGFEEDISPKTLELTKLIKPFKVELAGLDYLDDPLKCLFIKTKETEELINANLKAREVFFRTSDAIYTPHLSLMYGDFSKDIKENIISDLKKEREGKELSFSFDVEKIYLYSTKGEPDKWYKEKEFSLTS